MRLWPTKTQWSRWTLPSKLTAIGTLVGIASLIVAVLQLWPSSDGTTLDAGLVPEAFLSVTIAPIRPDDLDVTWFLPGKWAFSVSDTSSSENAGPKLTFQSASAFRLILTSALPPGSPEPIVDSLSLVVLARQPWRPRARVKTLLFSGGRSRRSGLICGLRTNSIDDVAAALAS